MKKYQMAFAGLFAALILCGCGAEKDFAEMMKKAEECAVAGKWEDALSYSKDAQEVNPNSIEAIILTTLAYEKNGKMNEALSEISNAVKIAPKRYFVQYTYGRILYKFKRNDQSISALKEAVKLNPQSTEAKILLARVANEQKDYRTAYVQYCNLLKDKSFKDKALLYNEIGVYFSQIRRNNNKALEYCNYAYKLSGKNNPSYVLNTAILCEQTKRVKTAKALYQYYCTLTKNDSSLAKNRAAVEARLRSL